MEQMKLLKNPEKENDRELTPSYNKYSVEGINSPNIISSRQIHRKNLRTKGSKRYLLFGLFVTISLFIIGLKTFVPSGSLIVYIYTIFITTFMFSRVVGSLFYKTPEDNLDYNYNPTVSFVIPCKNEEKAIFHTMQKCLESIYPEDKIEVIAINDGSTDGTLKEMLRLKRSFPNRKITIIDFKVNKGKREGMDAGFKIAKGEIVVQLDSDSYPAKEALRYLVNPFKNKDMAAVVGHTDPSNKDENLLTKMQTAYYFMAFRALKATESIFGTVFCCSGCCSAYRKSYVLPVLDEWKSEEFLGKKIIYGDDRALTNQMLKMGYKTVYSDKAQAYTIVPTDLKQFFKQQTRWKKGWFINSMKASKFILKTHPFVSITYFFPLILLTMLAPIIAFKALVVNPFILKISPMFYVIGILCVSLLLWTHYKIYDGGKYGKYLILWSILNMTVLSYILVYALYDLRNMSWGTR